MPPADRVMDMKKDMLHRFCIIIIVVSLCFTVMSYGWSLTKTQTLTHTRNVFAKGLESIHRFASM